MKAILVKLECLTNMHVGSEDTNYNIIDNEVQRDPITNYPIINASGVKGALRQYFLENEEWQDKVEIFFGSDVKGKSSPGRLKFLNAEMLALAVRASKGEEPYYLITTETALNRYEKNCRLFLQIEKNRIKKTVTNRMAEGIVLDTAVDIFGKDVHIMKEENFSQLELPVAARNKLENGISKNLWYEEIVPHESLFSFFVLANEKDQKLLEEFKAAVHEKVIQFGGNASIGYGLCNASVIGV